jgi:hypothetical protein
VRDALHRSTRKPLQWGGLAGYSQLVVLEEALRQVPVAVETTSLRQLAQRLAQAVAVCRPAAEDLAAAHALLRQIAATLGYGTAVTAAQHACPPLPARSSAQVRAEMEALLAAKPPLLSDRPARLALLAAWRRLWRTWGPELLFCYDIPAVPPDNLRLEGLFGRLRGHQRRISGTTSTRPLREFGAYQLLFAAESEAALLAQLRSVPYAAYRAQRCQLAEGEAERQSLRRLHHDAVGTITALLTQHALRRAVLAATCPLPALEHTD